MGISFHLSQSPLIKLQKNRNIIYTPKFLPDKEKAANLLIYCPKAYALLGVLFSHFGAGVHCKALVSQNAITDISRVHIFSDEQRLSIFVTDCQIRGQARLRRIIFQLGCKFIEILYFVGEKGCQCLY